MNEPKSSLLTNKQALKKVEASLTERHRKEKQCKISG